MGEWQPIETAPKNTGILIARNNKALNGVDEWEIYSVSLIHGAYGFGFCTMDGHEIFRATHWMPLPEPPHE